MKEQATEPKEAEKRENEISEKVQEKVQEKVAGTNKAGMIAICLVIAGVVFLVLLNIEKNLMENYEKQSVVMTTKLLPEGLVLNAETIPEYLEIKELETAAVPEGAYTNFEQLYDAMSAVSLEKGIILSSSLLTDKNEEVSKLKQPVVAGFKAEDISQIVCGTLRSGNRIHIYVTEKETGETSKVWENVFVEQVFDSSGAQITNEDTTASAQVVNILMDKSNVETFYTELAKGTIRVVKEY